MLWGRLMSLACLTPPLPLPCSIQVALRTNQLGVLYWEDSISLAALLAEDGTIDGQTFLSTWRTLPQELVRKLPLTISDIEAAKAKLQAVNLFVLAHRPVGNSGSNRMLC